MNNFLSVDYRLRTSDFDCRQKLQPASVLDFFQDVAGEHADILGIGRDAILPQKLVWVVVRIRFRVLDTPKIYSRIKVSTWPLEPNRAVFRREYTIEDENGKECVVGSSEWVLMHIEKRRIVPTRDIMHIEDGYLTRKLFEENFPRLPDFTPDGEGLRIVPGFSEIDVNGHVNNTKYANFVLDAAGLSSGEAIDTFQIEYHREIKKNSAVTVFVRREGKELLSKGVSDEGEKMFSCRIIFK